MHTTADERLVALGADVKHLIKITEQTRAHAEKTNGRVTALEAWRIDQDAREDERSHLAKRTAEAAADRISRRFRRLNAAVPVGCVVLGVALTWLAQRF